MLSKRMYEAVIDLKGYLMFLLATLVLIVIGFFSLRAWLIIVGGLIYFCASHKGRRAHADESRIKQMMAEGNTQTLSSDLFFETALSYAVSKGTKAAEKDAASPYFVVEGTTYFVVFTRAASGGTMSSVKKADRCKRRDGGSYQSCKHAHGAGPA
jgi:hypothetical protein